MHKIGICDNNISFAVGLADHINHEEAEFDAVIFSDSDMAASYLTQNDLDLILTDDVSGCRMRDGGLYFHNVRCMYLSDKRKGCDEYVAIGDDSGTAGPIGDKNKVFMYQKLGSIFDTVKKNIVDSPPVANSFTIEAVFSPLGRCGCTTLARALTEYSEGGRGIYVGMENYSPCGTPGSGILYQIKERIPELAETVRRCIISSEGIDELRAGSVYLDLRNVQKDDIFCLSDCLLQAGKYSYVIYDLGSAVADDPAILDCFDRIYMPVLDDEISLGKLESFESILRSMELRSVMAKLVKVHVFEAQKEEMAVFVRNLRYGKS